MLISGVVILYHPDPQEIIRNIHSYIDYVDILIIFDNSYSSPDLIKKIKAESSKIIFIQNEGNEGIAKPLNKALEMVIDKSLWLLTMDQDSYFEPAQASAFFNSFNKLFFHAENVAVLCPNHSDRAESSIINDDYEQVDKAITSGSVVNTRICSQLKGFEEKLFIDYVDFEYCYRCIMSGYKIIRFSNIYLNHTIGVKRQAGYFSVFKKSNRSIHSPFRVYFMVRNFLYVSKKYKRHLPEEIKQRKKELSVILKNNILFSGQFFRVLIAIIKGYLHFKQNKFSS